MPKEYRPDPDGQAKISPSLRGAPPGPPTDVEMAEWLRLLSSPDTSIEIRAPALRLPGKRKTVAVVRRFRGDHLIQAAQTAIKLSANATAVYFVLNGVDPSLPTDSQDNTGAKAGNIPRRRWILVDCDPERAKAGTSATDAEKAQAGAVAAAILEDLSAEGWPDPIYCDSGNGFHLLYRVDLPSEDGGLVKRVLEALARRFDSDGAKVDTSVHDAPRLTKFYGTMARKGEPTAERPHRFARVLRAPVASEVVPEAMLRAMAEPSRVEPEPAPQPRARPEPRRNSRREEPEPAALDARIVAYVATIDPAVEGQKGSNQTFKAACKVGPGYDLTPDDAFRYLRELYNPRCQPPWSEEELRRKVDEAYKKEPRRGWLLHEGRGGHTGNGSHAHNLKVKRAGPNHPPEPPAPTPDPAAERPARPEVEVNTERHIVVAETLRAIVADSDLYRRGPSLVSVVLDRDDELKLTAQTTMKGRAGSPRIINLSDAVVGCYLTKNSRFYQWKTPPKGEPYTVNAHPPDWLIKAVATHQHYPGMRPLLAVAECPFPRPDGTIVEAPGYDRETGTLYMPSIEFPPIPKRPNRDDARAAWGRIEQYFQEFPFASDDDRVVVLAGMLNVIARPAIPGPVPGIVVNGNKAGTGKGLLIDAMSIPGTGRVAPTSNYPVEKEEAVKVKVAIALGGDPVVHFDNLEEGTEYGNGAMDGAMTSSETKDRVLGSSDRPLLPLRPSWFISGNNLSPGSDAHRRWMVCNLVTHLESPEQRTDIVVRNLRSQMIEERPAIVADALTILKAHTLAGRPDNGWGPLGSFEEWDSVVRGAVWFATDRDCLATQRKTAEESPARLAKLALLEGWRELPGGRAGQNGVTVAEALAKVEESPEKFPTLRVALMQKGRGGKLPSSGSLGNLLRGLKNASIGGFKLTESGIKHRAVLWVVEGGVDDPADDAPLFD